MRIWVYYKAKKATLKTWAISATRDSIRPAESRASASASQHSRIVVQRSWNILTESHFSPTTSLPSAFFFRIITCVNEPKLNRIWSEPDVRNGTVLAVVFYWLHTLEYLHQSARHQVPVHRAGDIQRHHREAHDTAINTPTLPMQTHKYQYGERNHDWNLIQSLNNSQTDKNPKCKIRYQ